MPLSRQEIKQNAVNFAAEWHDDKCERAESQSFWNDFFAVFGVRRRSVASFEQKVKNIKGQFASIDLLWSGKLLAEHKSYGKSLDKAASQAFEYVHNLASENRSDEIPRYIIVSDFANIVLYDLESDEGDPEKIEFVLHDLHKHIDAFGFISGYKIHKPKPEDPANVQAAELMGRIHDALAAESYSGHALERFLVRILFCLFAEDTGIFSPDAFTAFIEQNTREDGGDLGQMLAQFFDTLDTPTARRQINLDESLVSLQYVDGGLFEETLRPPTCNRAIRNALLSATRFDWSRISPAIFGSMFQCVMDPDARRACGAHYTTEDNILKVIRPLFLDDLRNEFKKLASSKSKSSRALLQQFHEKLGNLTFFDPACGCGNFLVLAYRELRRLEMDVFEKLHKSGQKFLDTAFVSQVDVDQFYGIEIVEFPVRIAETALWLMDHQMNIEASVRFGNYYVRLPLQKSAKIVHGNALQLDWNDVLPKQKCSFILGNPPFVGKQYQNDVQKEDVQLVLSSLKGFGVLDYVCCWYIKAAHYIHDTKIPVGFVSTNSISQGEQAGILWTWLFSQGIHIHFAYQTFVWTSEAKGKAHVHCVIIGFSNENPEQKFLFHDMEGRITSRCVTNINPYLVEGNDVPLKSRTHPLCEVPECVFGSMPNDGGHFLFSDQEKKEFLKLEPASSEFFRRFLGADEFLNGISRWCLWLDGVSPSKLRSLRAIMERINLVRKYRESSKRETTRKLAKAASLFGEIRQPSAKYILIPRVSSERRDYIPIGFVAPRTIAGDATLIIPGAKLFHFGMLTSAMHNAWMRRVCGRLKSDYRYSAKIVYNNFPWPGGVHFENLTEAQKTRIEEKASAVLEVRKLFPDSTLSDLYDPLSMPAELLKAHRELDKAVDRAYRKEPFASDEERLAFLFQLYEKLTNAPTFISEMET
ncbi:MAG: class I SAM-dependent DNA methyltransferase [Thermoguttaceae bacterium]